MILPRRAAPLLFLALEACRAEPRPTGIMRDTPTTADTPSASGDPATSSPLPTQPPPARPREHLSARAVSIAAINGDIVARDGAGHEAHLTTAGTDDAPALSPDGKKVAFLRYPTASHDGPHDLYLARVSAGEPDLLVQDSPIELDSVGLPLQWLGVPEFSLDGDRVFFSVQNGRLGALCGVDLATKKVHWILTALETELIRKGPYRGHFFVVRREHSGNGDPEQEQEACYVLHSSTGNKLRSVRCNGGAQGAGAESLQNPSARKELGL